uniref:HORMA domain-containing protein n=1 Tax=Rhabditophanes sp. KR3021 TaxID=114890 RepID=A0AC35THE9_9BILA
MSALNITNATGGSSISLNGSSLAVKELFYYSLNNILFQRGILPQDTFERKEAFGIAVMHTTDPKLKDYMKKLSKQIQRWLINKELRKLVVAIVEVDTKVTIEKWDFEIRLDPSLTENLANSSVTIDDKKIALEMGSTLRQITSCVSFLPIIQKKCSFDVIAHTGDALAPDSEWEVTRERSMIEPTEVKLRTSSTGIHNVGAKVQYQLR